MIHSFSISVSREFDLSPEHLFDRWTDPDWRTRFETPEGSGMRYDSFDTRAGGTETVVIEADGVEVGRMIQEIRICDRPHRLLVQGRGVFGGTVMLTTQTAFDIDATADGARLTGTSQIAAQGDHPTQDEVRGGWEAMLDRFAALIEEEKTT